MATAGTVGEYVYEHCPVFDAEFFYWEENRKEYIGILPDHANEIWCYQADVNGKRMHGRCKRLADAKIERGRLLAMRGVK